jgi:membrane associated rhomboid family serine protease
MSAGEQAVRRGRERRVVDEWALVLAAAGIGARTARVAGGWRLLVANADAERARAALDAYEAERGSASAPEEPPEYGRTPVGFVVAALLVVFYAITGPADPTSSWARAGSASAALIARGEVWRAVTALTLHANAVHLLGNVFAGAVFVAGVGRALGPGLGIALVLASGAGGNVLDALLRGAPHTAVGASTAVFGAVGLLGGLQAGRKRQRRGAWIPLAGSLALLAMLGSDREADIVAHLFGLLVGGVLGVAAALAVARPPGQAAQWALGGGALALVLGCWARALAG